MPITVPPVPDGLHPAGCWRRLLTGLNPAARGGYRTEGALLYAGDTVELAPGSLLLTVDKATRGWEDHYRSAGRYAVEDATVTVYLAGVNTLTELWSRQYVSSKSAFGATTMKRLAALLEKHPAPGGEPDVVHEARRPNAREGACRWCRARIPADCGHVAGHGPDAQVEHYEDCPTGTAQSGQVCALCGVTVVGWQAAVHYLRDGSGEKGVRHRPVNGRTCLEEPVASPEEQAEERAERDRVRREQAAAERAEQARKDAARVKRAAARMAKRQTALAAEQARVAGLATISRASTALYDKGLGDGMRACLRQHTDGLEDGTTTLRWTVETYPEAYRGGVFEDDGDASGCEVREYTDLAEARSHYQTLHFQPAPRRRVPVSGKVCAECGRGDATVERRDSSGIPGMVCVACDRRNPDDFMLSFG